MLEIDGAYGEGGGQLVRTACALAAVTGTALRLRNIRARRDPPGLAPQHLAAVHAVAALCDARVENLAVRSRDIEFLPRALRGGNFRVDVGTAGSITLVLQALLPVAVRCPAPVSFGIIGGTDVRAAPSLDYFRFVLLPLLEGLGIAADVTLHRRGYYPRGGGEVTLSTRPSAVRALRLDEPGPVIEIGGVAHCANLPAHIAERMRHAASEHLPRDPAPRIETQVLGRDAAIGPGGAIALWARTGRSTLGASAVAERGVPAERLGEQAARELRVELDAGVTLDIHAADQVLVYAAQAREPSHFTARELSMHARTVGWLLEQFLPVRLSSARTGNVERIELGPAGPGR